LGDEEHVERPCGEMYPLGIVVHDASGFPIAVFNEFSFYSCPGEFFRSGFQFGRLGNITRSVYLDGYWTPGVTPVDGGYSMGILHSFRPGIYKVVAGNIWGHLAVTYFTVVSS
jgi:hypothetical protein